MPRQSIGHAGSTNIVVSGCDGMQLSEDLVRVGSLAEGQHAPLQTMIPVGAVQQAADGTATATIILQPMASVGARANFAGIHFINL